MITPDITQKPVSAAGPMPIPAKLLEIDGIAPAAGDETDATITLRIERMDGAIAFVRPVAINGQPLPTAAGGEAMPDDEEMERLALEADANPA
jgi:hypothetical protein